MRARQSVLCLAFLAASLGGVSPSAAQEDPYRDIHKIGIISALGNEITLQSYGTTRLGYSKTTTSVDWDIDSQILKLVSGALQGRFTVSQVNADASRLRSLMFERDLLGGYKLPDSTSVGRYLQLLPAAADVDAFVVVLAGANHLFTALGDYQLEGLGVVRKSNLFSSDVPVNPYAAYDVLVVDAKSGKLIAWAYGNDQGRAHSGTMASLCSRDIRVKNVAELTGTQEAIIRDELKFLVFSSLSNTLKQIGLPSGLDVSQVMPARPSICMTP